MAKRSAIRWRDMGEIHYRSSRLLRALSNPKAYSLCRLLLDRGEMNTTELKVQLGRSQAAVSKILRTLRDLNVVRYQKESKMTWYTIKHVERLEAILAAAEQFIRSSEEGLETAD